MQRYSCMLKCVFLHYYPFFQGYKAVICNILVYDFHFPQHNIHNSDVHFSESKKICIIIAHHIIIMMRFMLHYMKSSSSISVHYFLVFTNFFKFPVSIYQSNDDRAPICQENTPPDTSYTHPHCHCKEWENHDRYQELSIKT